MLHVFTPFLVWEGPYVDMWSIAHFMVGVIIAYMLYRLMYEKWQGFAIAVLFGILWELVEQYILHTRALETNTNSVMDVACAAIGYLAGYWLLHSQLSARDKKVVGIFAICIFLVVCALRVLGA